MIALDIKKVLVAVSGGRADDEAIILACKLAKQSKAKIYAIYVIEVKRALPLDADLPMESTWGEEVLSHAETVAEKQDCALEIELLQARQAGPAIVDEARERGIDLIILGMDYKLHFGEFTLGRAAPYVLRNAACRVWICREPAEIHA